MNYICAYCKKPTDNGGWVEADTEIGWQPNCWETDCRRKAEADMIRQQMAKNMYNV